MNGDNLEKTIGQEYQRMVEELKRQEEELKQVISDITEFVGQTADTIDYTMTIRDFLGLIKGNEDITYGQKEFDRLIGYIYSDIEKIDLDMKVWDFIYACEKRLEEIKHLLNPGPEAPNFDLQS